LMTASGFPMSPSPSLPHITTAAGCFLEHAIPPTDLPVHLLAGVNRWMCTVGRRSGAWVGVHTLAAFPLISPVWLGLLSGRQRAAPWCLNAAAKGSPDCNWRPWLWGPTS
jgi:hypothetical protein